MTHGMADIEPGLRLHYVTEGEGPRTLVLLHGFPQTWWEWHGVIADFAEAGFRVVAPDYRGAGNSWKPAGGYDKRTMAGDIRRLAPRPPRRRRRDRARRPRHRPDGRLRLRAGLPRRGLAPRAGRRADPRHQVFDRLRSDPRVWHFAFHGARDLPEMLVHGRERQYLQYFFDARSTDPSVIDLDVYAAAYEAPGAMRAGFELYRAFEQDARDNRGASNG